MNRLTMIVLAIVAALAFGYWYGRYDGSVRCAAARDSALLDQIEAGRKLDAARRTAALERDQLAAELERLGNEDQSGTSDCVSTDRVRRLNRLR